MDGFPQGIPLRSFFEGRVFVLFRKLIFRGMNGTLVDIGMVLVVVWWGMDEVGLFICHGKKSTASSGNFRELRSPRVRVRVFRFIQVSQTEHT